MKKYIYLFIGIIISGLIITGLNFSEIVEAYDRSYGLERYQCQSATSSPDYLTTGTATSTCIIEIPRTINGDLNIYAIASTSSSTLNIEAYDSFDSKTAATKEWYPHKEYTDSGSTRAWESGARVNTIPLDSTTASTSRHKINLGTLRANALKIEYAVADDNAAVYLEVVKENDK